MSDMPVNPKEKKKGKYEEYELEDGLRTMQSAHKIMGDTHMMKALHKHARAKKSQLHDISKMMKNDEEESVNNMEEEKQEIKSIDQIRSRRKKLKDKMTKVE